MTKMKKIVAGALTAAAMMTSILSIGASAGSYVDSGTWQFYSNPYVSNTTSDFNLNAYSGGYKAMITSKSNGGSYNYVTVTSGSNQVTLTEKDAPCNTIYIKDFNKDGDGTSYVSFRVKLFFEKAPTTTETVTNNGKIGTTRDF